MIKINIPNRVFTCLLALACLRSIMFPLIGWIIKSKNDKNANIYKTDCNYDLIEYPDYFGALHCDKILYNVTNTCLEKCYYIEKKYKHSVIFFLMGVIIPIILIFIGCFLKRIQKTET
jgi:hypothetical protein